MLFTAIANGNLLLKHSANSTFINKGYCKRIILYLMLIRYIGVHSTSGHRRVSLFDAGMIVGISVACAALVLIIVGSVIYFRTHPNKLETIAINASRTKRSLQGRV